MSQTYMDNALAQLLESNENMRQSQISSYLAKILSSALENSYQYSGFGSAESIFEKTKERIFIHDEMRGKFKERN